MKAKGLRFVVSFGLMICVSRPSIADSIYEINANGTAGKYTTGGHTINGSFLSGIITGGWLVVTGNNLYVDQGSGDASDSIGLYDATTGATINSSLVVPPWITCRESRSAAESCTRSAARMEPTGPDVLASMTQRLAQR
ncbi:MAG: hypothetical protein M3R59_01320 [Verrucomicrobiota bacterium]|nr:hypothetical protein [Verrucomicrobiota bacterium]